MQTLLLHYIALNETILGQTRHKLYNITHAGLFATFSKKRFMMPVPFSPFRRNSGMGFDPDNKVSPAGVNPPQDEGAPRLEPPEPPQLVLPSLSKRLSSIVNQQVSSVCPNTAKNGDANKRSMVCPAQHSTMDDSRHQSTTIRTCDTCQLTTDSLHGSPRSMALHHGPMRPGYSFDLQTQENRE